MRSFSILIWCFWVSLSFVHAQQSYPNWRAEALVSEHQTVASIQKPYTIVVYGSLGCGYSNYLLQHLSRLDESASEADVVVILQEEKALIQQEKPELVASYKVFSNQLLGFTPRKNADRFPHIFVFKDRELVYSVLGLKKGMLTKINERIKKEI
jgi:thioredoxin-related protein